MNFNKKLKKCFSPGIFEITFLYILNDNLQIIKDKFDLGQG